MRSNPKNVRHPTVSFVLATHNRREVVTATLKRLVECGLPRGEFEIIVVDNASEDGTADVVTGIADHVLRLGRNRGSCAKHYGVEVARSPFIVFLDDDSHPRPDSIQRMIERFEDDPRLATAGFRVHLPDGQEECSALPSVFVGCGVGFRAKALREAGGLDPTFFMQAEEYDLSFRLVGAGWRIGMFADLHVDHLKAAGGRRNERTVYYDVCNNLRIAARYLPSPYRRIYRQDWLQRYRWLAEPADHLAAFRRGARAGRLHGAWERWSYRSRRLGDVAFEHFFRLQYVARRMQELAESGVRRILLADLGKNVFAFRAGAEDAGLEIVAISDDRFCGPNRRYRGLPIVPLDEALGLTADAVVVSNMADVFAVRTQRNVAAKTALPVHNWFAPPDFPADQETSSCGHAVLTDETTRAGTADQGVLARG